VVERLSGFGRSVSSIRLVHVITIVTIHIYTL